MVDSRASRKQRERVLGVVTAKRSVLPNFTFRVLPLLPSGLSPDVPCACWVLMTGTIAGNIATPHRFISGNFGYLLQNGPPRSPSQPSDGAAGFGPPHSSNDRIYQWRPSRTCRAIMAVMRPGHADGSFRCDLGWNVHSGFLVTRVRSVSIPAPTHDPTVKAHCHP